jgi:hypothetical protein
MQKGQPQGCLFALWWWARNGIEIDLLGQLNRLRLFFA